MKYIKEWWDLAPAMTTCAVLYIAGILATCLYVRFISATLESILFAVFWIGFGGFGLVRLGWSIDEVIWANRERER